MYTRLNKLGVSVSHSTTLATVRKLGIDHDSQVVQWKNVSDHSQNVQPSYIIVGDNLDKNVKPRDMRIDHQVKSMHWFHSYAVSDRVEIGDLCGDGHIGDVTTLPISAVLPTVTDCVQMRKHYICLTARLIVQNLPYFAPLQKCVPAHIPHRYSEEMAKKSVIVSKHTLYTL